MFDDSCLSVAAISLMRMNTLDVIDLSRCVHSTRHCLLISSANEREKEKRKEYSFDLHASFLSPSANINIDINSHAEMNQK